MAFFTRQENNDVLFHLVTPKVHAFVTLCYLWMLPSAMSAVLRRPYHCVQLLARLHHCGACDQQGQALPTAQQTAELLQQFWRECLELSTCSPDFPQSDVHPSGPLKEHVGRRRFHTDAEVRKLSQSGSSRRAHKFVPKATCTENTLWQMPEPLGRLCEKVAHCSVFSWEMRFWIKICRTSRYSQCVFTLRLSYV
jgi:hypothetical protein